MTLLSKPEITDEPCSYADVAQWSDDDFLTKVGHTSEVNVAWKMVSICQINKEAPMEVRLEHISKKYGSKYALRDFTATPERRSVMKISEIRCPYMAI